MIFGRLRAPTRAARVLGVAAGISRGRVRIARYQATNTVSFSGRSGPASLEKEGALTMRRKGRALRLLLQEAEAPWAVVLLWVAMSSAPGPHGAVPAGRGMPRARDAGSASFAGRPQEVAGSGGKRSGAVGAAYLSPGKQRGTCRRRLCPPEVNSFQASGHVNVDRLARRVLVSHCTWS